MSLKTVPYKDNYVFGRGRAFIGLKNAAGVSEGLREVGNAPGFALAVKADLFQHTSSKSGLSEVDFTQPKSVDRSGTLNIDNITDRNLALAIAANLKTLVQDATPVVAEIITGVSPGAHYQLGKSQGNPTGVRNVSAVAVTLVQSDTAAAHAVSTAYALGAFVKSTTHLFVVTEAGASAAMAPAFATGAVGDTTVDGTATLTYVGETGVEYAVTTDGSNNDYVLDAKYALLGVLNTGALADIFALLPVIGQDSDGNDIYPSIDLSVDYTPDASKRTQLITGDVPKLSAEFKYISDNPTGGNRDCYCADVTVTPSGDLTWITSDKNMDMTLTISVNKLDSLTPALIVDGEPTPV